MSSHAIVTTEIKSAAVLDRTCAKLGCGTSSAVKQHYVAGRKHDGQLFQFPHGNHKGSAVANLGTGELYHDSDYSRSIPKFVDAYSLEVVKAQAEAQGLAFRESVNAQGEAFVEVFV